MVNSSPYATTRTASALQVLWAAIECHTAPVNTAATAAATRGTTAAATAAITVATTASTGATTTATTTAVN